MGHDTGEKVTLKGMNQKFIRDIEDFRSLTHSSATDDFAKVA